LNRVNPDGHPKLLHLWPPKLLQAGRINYPKNSSYPAAVSAGGGVGSVF